MTWTSINDSTSWDPIVGTGGPPWSPTTSELLVLEALEPTTSLRLSGIRLVVNNTAPFNPGSVEVTLESGGAVLASVTEPMAPEQPTPVELLFPEGAYEDYTLTVSNSFYTFWSVDDIEGFVEEPAEEAGPASVNCDCNVTENTQTLATLRRRLLLRLGFGAQLAALPPSMEELATEFLTSAQRKLFNMPQTEHMLERFFEWPVVEGQRLYGLRESLDEDCERYLAPRRVTWAGIVDQNQVWHRLTYGIPPEFYTNLNPSLPVRYEIRQCIEIFPPPDNSDYRLIIKGDFGLQRFEEDDDLPTFDEELVFLTALADAQAYFGKPEAADTKAEQQSYMRTLVASSHMQQRYVPGAGPGMPWPRPTLTEFIE